MFPFQRELWYGWLIRFLQPVSKTTEAELSNLVPPRKSSIALEPRARVRRRLYCPCNRSRIRRRSIWRSPDAARFRGRCCLQQSTLDIDTAVPHRSHPLPVCRLDSRLELRSRVPPVTPNWRAPCLRAEPADPCRGNRSGFPRSLYTTSLPPIAPGRERPVANAYCRHRRPQSTR